MNPLRSLAFGDLLDQLGSRTPAPGGGAAAAAAGALAAALARMVVAYSIGKKDLAEHQPALERASGALVRMGDLLLRLADEDAAAYALVHALSRLPPGDARRDREYGAAVDAAVQAPRNAIAICCDLLSLLESLSASTNPRLRSDLAIAAVLAEAAARAASWNVTANLALLPDGAGRSAIAVETARLLREAADRRVSIEGACAR